jgi:triosephosphate isomerase
MNKYMVVANWKMNLNPHEASLLVSRLNQTIKPMAGTEIVICPPFIDLYSMSKELDRKTFGLGSQNIHYLDNGAFTGEISPAMLKGMVDYSIIGHSERRIYAHEDDALIAKKVAAALRNAIKPILCVGDSLLDYQHGNGTKVVVDQLEADLHNVTAAQIEDIVIAYEPVWAIGTGNFAKPEDVVPVVAAIRNLIKGLYGEPASKAVKILYGGSVNPDSTKVYLGVEGINGLLVGGASLNYAEFTSIVESAQKHTAAQ